MKITKKQVKSFIELNIGVFLAAIAVAYFLNPYNMAAGGASGLAILLQGFFDIPMAIFIYSINAILLIVSFFLMGKKFFIKTAYGTCVYPFFVSLVQLVMKYLPEYNLDMFLVVIFGALIMGFGMGLAYRNGGTTGGGDIIQAIFFKFFHIPYSKTMIVMDGLIVSIGTIIFGLESTLCAIIFIVLTGQIVDMVTFGGYNKRSVYIVTNKHDEVKEYIINTLVRGVTSLEGFGGYTNAEKRVILCILSTNEYLQLRSYLETVDQEAFVFVNKATEVRGYGFSIEDPARIKAKKR